MFRLYTIKQKFPGHCIVSSACINAGTQYCSKSTSEWINNQHENKNACFCAALFCRGAICWGRARKRTPCIGKNSTETLEDTKGPVSFPLEWPWCLTGQRNEDGMRKSRNGNKRFVVSEIPPGLSASISASPLSAACICFNSGFSCTSGNRVLVWMF